MKLSWKNLDAVAIFASAIGLSACSIEGEGASVDHGSYPGDTEYRESQRPQAGADAGLATNPDVNPWMDTAVENTSTFAIDVDTGSYTLARRALLEGQRPDPSTVRVEEFVNFFAYDYPEPEGDAPFSVDWEAAPSPLGENRTLLRIGLQGRRIPEEERLHANLVFLVDVSGSMQSADKLPLVQYALKELVRRLSPDDTIGIVTYAGADAIALQPTPVSERGVILDVVENLAAGGSTNGAAGIVSAYELAESVFVDGAINRVVLCTDGDFNVGLTGDALIDLIEEKRDTGVFLTTLGFGAGYGVGNYNDGTLEGLADHGNGHYAYIDNRGEAVRVLGENLVSTLQVIAKDVKIQVEFNTDFVKSFRLVGYENRVLANDDFANDMVDGGEIGAGHQVTAFYELEFKDSLEAADTNAPLAALRIRHKEPDGDVSTETEYSWTRSQIHADFAAASSDFQFATSVVEFAEILRDSPFKSVRPLNDIQATAIANTGYGSCRLEFVSLFDQIH